MVLPIVPTNSISFSQIQAEFGGTNPISLSEYFANATTGYTAGIDGIPNSTTNPTTSISVSQFSGKTKQIILTETVYNFNYTGTIQSLILPATAQYISVDLNGASGSAGRQPEMGYDGGLGGKLVASNISVTGGTTIYIVVGYVGISPGGARYGGGGGGYTAVMNDTTPSIATWFACAGGGGGGGSAIYVGNPFIGGSPGENGGTNYVTSNSSLTVGAGGISIANGSAGTATGGGNGGSTSGSNIPGGGGGGGSYGLNGGSGGIGGGNYSSTNAGGIGGYGGGGGGGGNGVGGNIARVCPGGGGGGGYIGGNGGYCNTTNGGQGGRGGYNYMISTGTLISSGSRTNTGNGSATITVYS